MLDIYYLNVSLSALFNICKPCNEQTMRLPVKVVIAWWTSDQPSHLSYFIGTRPERWCMFISTFTVCSHHVFL